MSTSQGLQILRKIVQQSTREYKGFENVLKSVRVLSGGGGTCKCALHVGEEHQNRGGTLHGGLTCTLVDAVSTWALMATEEPVAGVSVDLSVSFMKGARVGEEIVVDARILKRGKRLAFLSVDITNMADGTLLAQGKHTKYVGS
ncbi:acyl-coenzyme A thioesterase 13-like [Dreissena polymorpha]|nr:acyl-coenzyme A thioesterase 13-like [Dreissena polymorpha]